MTKIVEGNMASSQQRGKNNKRTVAVALMNDGATTDSDNSNNRLTMEAILHRYHSLAKAHYAETKRRHVESNQRTLENTHRMQQLTNLQRMASETHALATSLLRSEQHLHRENQRERQDIERDLKKAEQERALAEDFLRKIGGAGGYCFDYTAAENSMGGGEGVHVDNDRGTIGGVPRKFLDLSHFPKLREGGSRGDAYKSDDDDDEDIIGYTQKCSKKQRSSLHNIIDCTEAEDTEEKQSSYSMHLDENFPTRIPSHQAMETTTTTTVPSKTQKKNTKRIYISHATLSHVNGTYIQEVGCYNNAPVFVLAGPPRRFLGYDCSIVLRRERISSEEYQSLSRRDDVIPSSSRNQGSSSSNSSSASPHHFIWKIGLAPALRVTHPRLIGYYFAHEDVRDCAVMSSMDLMGDEEDSSYFEPPVGGWRVFQEYGQGRVSGLKVNYEE